MQQMLQLVERLPFTAAERDAIGDALTSQVGQDLGVRGVAG